MSLITPSHYPQIRAALGVSVDNDALPGTIIGMDIYAGRAQAWIEQNDPAWATRAGTELQHLTRAAILRTAGLLAPTMPTMTSESFGAEYSYSGGAVDWYARADDLMAASVSELQIVLLGTTASPVVPAFFTVAHGYRGR